MLKRLIPNAPRTLLLALLAAVMLAMPAAAEGESFEEDDPFADEEDPFADEEDPFAGESENDPFAGEEEEAEFFDDYENEAAEAESNLSKEGAAASSSDAAGNLLAEDGGDGAADGAAKPAEADNSQKVPGPAVFAALGAVAVAAFVARRR